MTGSGAPGDARLIRRRGLAEGWAEPQIAEAIHQQCGVSLLRAHRMARGWTLEDAVVELRSVYSAVWGSEPALSHQRVSQWEKGADAPSPRYLDTLCRLYESRPDRLGFGNDYGAESKDVTGAMKSEIEMPAPQSKVQMHAQRTQDHSLEPLPASGLPDDSAADALDDRLSPRFLATLQVIRARADVLLETQSVCAATVDRWESLADEYGERQLYAPLDVFLKDAVEDFSRLQDIFTHRQPLEFQHRLYRVMAQLAGLIGFDLMGSGALRESHDWYHTARLAAEETGDRQLRAWLAACESMSYFWDYNLAGHAVSLCQAAQVMAGSAPSPAGAFAASVEARACARLGRRREALDAIHRAEMIFELLDPPQTRSTRLGFYEGRLRYDQENALTRLGEISAAMDVQERALEISPGESVIESTMIRLDRASCLISCDEIEEGYSTAERVLLNVPPRRRRGVILLRTRELDSICRSRSRQVTAGRRLHDIVIPHNEDRPNPSDRQQSGNH